MNVRALAYENDTAGATAEVFFASEIEKSFRINDI